jgi:apolipoprotein N-acyltransferase
MTAQLPLGRIPTLYARTGDWFSWLCVAGLAALLAVAIVNAAERSVVQLMTRQLFVFGRMK